MAYLYLNFEENLQSGSKNWDDFCTESLQAQYEKLKAKLGSLAPETLQGFIQSALAPAKLLDDQQSHRLVIYRYTGNVLHRKLMFKKALYFPSASPVCRS